MMVRIARLALVVVCFTALAIAQVPSSNHIYLIIEENHSDTSVIGNSAMPYLNSLAQKYGYASQYYANAHSSITDYFAITAGQVVETADWTTSTYSQDNIVRQLNLGGKSWKVYAESIPSAGWLGGDSYPYAQNHNPFAYYTDVANSATQAAKMVPFSQFASDLSAGSLPNYSYIVPNQEHNAHDCPDGTSNCTDATKLSTADTWLQTNIDPLIQSPGFQQDGILVITYDESEGGDNAFGGGHVATIVVGPKVNAGFQSNVFYQHESALKMMMEALGLTSPLAGTELAPDMADFFGRTNSQAPVSISPPTLFLGYPTVNTTSAARTATLTNNQSVPLNISSIVASSQYAQSSNCPSQLAPGGSCTLNVTFTPTTSVIQHGTISISDDGPGSPQIIYLAGTGSGTGSTNPAPTVTAVSPNSGSSAGATTITISGSDFRSPTVTIGGNAATGIVVNSSTQLTATTPAHTTGLVDVKVTDSDGQSATLPGAFTYTSAGTVPIATLSPTSLTFGNQQVGTSSSAQTVTLTNSGGGTLSISTIAASGDFLESNNCGASLGSGASCTILVSFTPSQTGTRTGTLSVTDSASGSPHTVSLTGNGTTTQACSAPSAPGVVVCAPLDGATVTSPVNFVAKATPASGQTISAMYVYLDDVIVFKALNTNSVNTNVTASLGSHVIRTQVWDSSGALYKAGSTITVTNNASPAVSLTPGSVTFSGQVVGTTSAAQSVTLTNTGGASLTISGIAASGDFAQTNGCTSSLAAGASCNIAVTFTPTQTGARTGALTVTDSASGSPHMVSLSGTGNAATAAAVTFSPSSLTFASQTVGTTSSAQSVTLTNSGGSALTISGIAPTVDFAETNSCPASLAAGASCNIAVTFTPSQTGTRTGSISVTDSATGSPHTVGLTGTGVAPSPAAAALSPTSLTFSNQQVGTTSAAQSITVTNSGGSALTVSGIAASGDFAETNNCPASLAAGAKCTVNVTFTPSQSGTRTGTLTITDSASGNPHTASLTGTGTTTQACAPPASAGVVVCAPLDGATVTSPVDFVASATPASGQTISAMYVYLDDVIVFKALNASTVNTNVTASAGSHVIRTQVWDSSGALYKAGSTITVTTSTTPAVSLSPTSVTFANQTVGTTSAAQSVTLTNTGGAALTISGIAASGDYAQTNNCPATVSAGASCIISVTFTPSQTGTRTGAVTVTDSAGGSPHSVALSGTGVTAAAAAVTLSPTSLTFASQNVGTTSAAQSVTLTNSGGSALTISGIAASGDYAQTNNCPATVSAGASCIISVTFTPSQTGTRTGAVTVTDSASGSPHSVALSGTGGTNTACAPPSAPGVVVCAPLNGATVSSPVNFVAMATPASGETISAMYVYLDDVVVFKALNTNSVNTNVAASTGTHVIRTQVWDTSGALYKAGSTITVK